MATRPKRDPRPPPEPPPPEPIPIPVIPSLDPTTGDNTVSVFEELAAILQALTEGKTLTVGGAAGSELNYTSEVVLIQVAGSGTSAYAVQKDGWVQNVISNVGTQWCLAVNVDPPAAVLGSAGIFTGLIWYPLGATPGDRIAAQAPMRIPVKAADILRVKNYTATITGIMVVLSYPLPSTVSLTP